MKADSSERSTPLAISLMGFRGTGKSSVGQILASRLGWPCIDTDQRVVQTAGTTIANVFAQRGEDGFRELESGVLQEIGRELAAGPAQVSPAVVSLGGGAVLRPANRALVRSWGPVVWLTADAESIFHRLTGDPHSAANRPQLTDHDLWTEISAKLAERRPIYESTATITVDTTAGSVDDIATTILQQLHLPGR